MNSRRKICLTVFSIFAFCICLFIFAQIQSCAPPPPPPPSPPDLSDILEPKTEKLKANVLIDASGSMKGFVNLPNTSYIDVIDALELPFVKGWAKMPVVTYHKFSETLQVLPGRKFKEAKQPSFYTGKFTKIQTAFDCVDLSCLNIVVTDLLQSDNDTMLLIGILKDKLNRYNVKSAPNKPNKSAGKNMSVAIGVLGIKSNYADKASIARTTHPFYIIMLGKHSDVVNYYELMKSSNSLKDEMGFTVLSNHLVENMFPGLGPDNIYQQSNISKKANFVRVSQNGKKKSKEDESILAGKNFVQIRIMRRKKDAQSALKFENKPLPHTIPFDYKMVKPEVTIERLKKDEFEPFDEDNIIIESSELTADKFDIKLKIQPDKLQKKRVYRYKFVFRPPESSYKYPDWWSDDESSASTNASNLYLFMDSLWQSMVQIYQPRVAEFYCYIKVP